MRKICAIILGIFLSFSAFAQIFYYEQNVAGTPNFGLLNDYTLARDTRVEDGSLRQIFDKSEGWEMVGYDQGLFYYQITDQNSANYGQIDTYDGTNRENWGKLGDFLTTPKIWTVVGVDDEKIYYMVTQTGNAWYGRIEEWDGTTRTVIGARQDVANSWQNWTISGVFDGQIFYFVHVENTNYGNTRSRSFDGSVTVTHTHMRDIFWTGPYSWVLSGVGAEKPEASVFVNSANRVIAHINGSATLTSAEIDAERVILASNITLLRDDEASIQVAFDLVHEYETKFQGLFTVGSSTVGGFSRSSTGFDLENLVLVVQQGLIDESYTQENLENFTSVFSNSKFETSSFFPGAVDIPSNPNVNYTVPINGVHMPHYGTKSLYEEQDARRPTGCYLAPGSVAEITVPQSLVGIGATVLVGAHTWDLRGKPTIARMDRVTTKYEINSTTVTVGNPLGGGIYINIPYRQDVGVIDITLKNVVRSPFYSRTPAKTTTLSEWQSTERSNPAPWADFETERFMMQVPTAWIYNMNDPESLMDDWDAAIDAVSELHGRPLIRSKTPLYSQVDVIFRGTANFPGYPTSNHPYNPNNTHTAGNFTGHPFIQGPSKNINNLNVLFHEMGHGERISKFTGESEAYVNFLWVAVKNKAFGLDLDKAFQESFSPNFNMSIDHAAISWMITETFREGKRMTDALGNREFAYQHRGYGKYAEIVQLFGWEALEDFQLQVSEDFEKDGTIYELNTDPTDNRILRMSRAAGKDLRPLMHFWGMLPISFNALENSIEAEEGIVKSALIYDKLQYYKTLIPTTNAAFRSFGLKHFGQNNILNYSGTNTLSYGEGFYNLWWNEYDGEEADAAYAEVERIIDLYFPDGRPCEETVLKPFYNINTTGWKNGTSFSINEGDQVTLGPQPTSSAAWSWSGPNGFTASTREITITGVSTIDNNIYVGTYTDDFDCQTSLYFDIEVSTITSINPEDLSMLEVYPSVFDEFITIDNVKESSKIEIVNSQGVTVYSDHVFGTKTISTNTLIPGVYYLKISAQESDVFKVIKR